MAIYLLSKSFIYDLSVVNLSDTILTSTNFSVQKTRRFVENYDKIRKHSKPHVGRQILYCSVKNRIKIKIVLGKFSIRTTFNTLKMQ